MPYVETGPVRPDSEIEITPDMIEAGVEASWRHDVDEDWNEMVRRVYIAMLRASAKAQSEPRG